MFSRGSPVTRTADTQYENIIKLAIISNRAKKNRGNIKHDVGMEGKLTKKVFKVVHTVLKGATLSSPILERDSCNHRKSGRQCVRVGDYVWRSVSRSNTAHIHSQLTIGGLASGFSRRRGHPTDTSLRNPSCTHMHRRDNIHICD